MTTPVQGNQPSEAFTGDSSPFVRRTVEFDGDAAVLFEGGIVLDPNSFGQGPDGYIPLLITGMLDAHEVLLGECLPEDDDDTDEGYVGPFGWIRHRFIKDVLYLARVAETEQVKVKRDIYIESNFIQSTCVDDAIAVGERLKLWTHDSSTDVLTLIGRGRELACPHDEEI